MDYLDKFKQYMKETKLDPVGKEDDDIDNDGDLDLHTAYTLYRNNGNSNNWLKVHHNFYV